MGQLLSLPFSLTLLNQPILMLPMNVLLNAQEITIKDLRPCSKLLLAHHQLHHVDAMLALLNPKRSQRRRRAPLMPLRKLSRKWKRRKKRKNLLRKPRRLFQRSREAEKAAD